MNKRDRFKHQSNKFKITFRNGRFEIPGADTWHTYWREPYYLLLTIPWWLFLGLTILSYLAINTLFAVGFLLGGDCIENATPGSFGDAFFLASRL